MDLEADGGAGSPQVRRLTAAEVRPLSASLAKAFYDDPVSEYLFPAERGRLRRLEWYFRLQIRSVFLARGESWTSSGLEGGALWMPPRQSALTPREGLGQLPIVAILGRRTGPAMRLVRLLEDNHPRTPHFYLGPIGIDPDAQRRGLGSALMEAVLARCDEEGIPAYLESSKLKNLAFFHKHRFEVVKQVVLPGTALTLWLMWREPKPA